MSVVAPARPLPPPEPPSAAAAPPASAEQRVTLRGVSWETYRTLRSNPANGRTRMTYDRGELELMTVGFPHENVAWAIGYLVAAYAEVVGVKFRPSGQLTLAREELGRGLEGDVSFYIRNFEAMRGREEFDVRRDPPPDLAVEVQFSRPAIGKLPIYAALGVPEVWLWRGGQITALTLTDAGGYQPAADSLNLPGFPFAEAAALIDRRADLDQTEITAAFRSVCRSRG